jgi:TRAP-type C4-dicarboxylate transport system permease small subunit
MELLEKPFNHVCRFFDRIARLSILIMTLLVVADIVLRITWKPISGMYDYICFLGVMIIAFALPYSAVLKGNIQVELLVSRLPKRVQAVIDTITGLLSCAFFLLVSWQSFVFANEMRRSGEITMTTHLPFYPFLYVISLMCLLVSFAIIFQIMDSIKAVEK